ncbi:2'-5' RNA ligase family protein [Luteipulveratus flavus]|uniref:2'-5' RNA ligase family protein n=1 Tax=Luteipulveratus flavus TaxID=3031728 RepID=A0ABT6C2D5_9MICO|nr:2'-5' RNA ligase family protein [Luteipulveratus sp. YIM 133296]MDF8263086.1 2'-5' RNA ligase family protein [Luteipulveratus sp. YIM 133296]
MNGEERTIGVSVPVPAPHGEHLQAVRRDVGDPLADAVPSHVTLMPPTPVDRTLWRRLTAHLAAIAAGAKPFRMTLRGTGTFRPVSPVVFVAVAEGISSCEMLERQVRSGPVHRELDFPYHPHVTIAHGIDEDGLDEAFDTLSAYECSFDVDGFDLYEHGRDQVWRSIRRFDFGAASS